MPKLKVFRTSTGFHDAYVAAPSQKAALVAWGTESNLFTQGLAEQVTDEASTAEALAHPGVVIKKLRGTEAEHLAALWPMPERAKATTKPITEIEQASPPPPAKTNFKPFALSLSKGHLVPAVLRQAQHERPGQVFFLFRGFVSSCETNCIAFPG